MTSQFRHNSQLITIATLACAAGAALTLATARAETPIGVHSLAEAKAMYEHDVAACRNHELDEDTKTCMLEAKRAYEDGKREALHQKGTHQSKKPMEENTQQQ